MSAALLCGSWFGLGDLVRPVPYRALQTLLDGAAAPGSGAYWRSVRLTQLWRRRRSEPVRAAGAPVTGTTDRPGRVPHRDATGRRPVPRRTQ